MDPTQPLVRPDPYVVVRILERLWTGGSPMLKTRLQVASNINYDVFRRYVSWMVEKGLVEVRNLDDGHDGVFLTRKGEETYGQLIRWVNDFIHLRD